jgi:flavorubredoxin
MKRADRLPREIAEGVFWLGECLPMLYRGKMLHGYNSAYLVTGTDCSLLVEAGHPKDTLVIEQQLDSLIGTTAPELRYIVTTHSETPHSGGLGRLLAKYPFAQFYGDGPELALVFPEVADRLHAVGTAKGFDLGGTEFRFVDAVIRDLPDTRWGYDAQRKVLFPGDGFAYAHYHEDSHCGLLAEEAASLDLPDMTALFAELALYWTRFRDITPFVEWLTQTLEELDVQLIAPTHGLPTADLDAIVPEILRGLRLGSEAHRHQ